MKKAKKVVALALCAVMLVVGSVAGTMAYLSSSTDVVTNTFTVGKVAITLDEAKVDLYGKVDGNERVLGNEYKLMPGHTYVKDPTVTVTAGSEESYVRMIVTISDLADLKAACGVTGQFYPQNFVNGWDSSVWECVSMNENANGTVGTYEFRYYTTVDTLNNKDLKLDALFDEFTMPSGATNDQILALEDVQIDVVAHAIQADGFEGDADKAWKAFDGKTE